MKPIVVITVSALVLSMLPLYAQNVTPVSDSTMVSKKIEELIKEKDMLESQISMEDAKRNQSVSGIAPKTQERLNDRQDSLCLALRSRLLSVELELSELVPDKTIGVIVNHFEDMKRNNANK